MLNLNVSLPEALKEYAEQQIDFGRYGTVSEYLCELIREDMKRDAQERLEALLLEGLENGNPIPVTQQLWENLGVRLDVKRKGAA